MADMETASTSAATSPLQFQLSYKGNVHSVAFDSHHVTLQALGAAVEGTTGAAFSTLKLMVAGVKGLIVPASQPEKLILEAGITTSCKITVLGSTAEEVEKIRAARDLPAMAGFEHEQRREARRRRRGPQALSPPSGEFTFQSYEAWQHPGLSPPPSEALKLLYRLASDPGIIHVMAKHGYKVSLLSEMPPEGKVGISPVCILGVNINVGQEISLRLRTDDLKGFRKYEKIRLTLIHELAHMEFGEHDNNFKELNSRLGKEVEEVHRQLTSAGHVLLAAAAELESEEMEIDDHLPEVMRETARLSGRTLRELAASDGAAAVAATADARAAAATAALRRHGATTTVVTGRVEVSVSPGSPATPDADDIATKYEHEDAATEKAEEAMQQLERMDDTTQNTSTTVHPNTIPSVDDMPLGTSPTLYPVDIESRPHSDAAAIAAQDPNLGPGSHLPTVINDTQQSLNHHNIPTPMDVNTPQPVNSTHDLESELIAQSPTPSYKHHPDTSSARTGTPNNHFIASPDHQMITRSSNPQSSIPAALSLSSPIQPPTGSASLPIQPPTDSASLPTQPSTDSASLPTQPPIDSSSSPTSPPVNSVAVSSPGPSLTIKVTLDPWDVLIGTASTTADDSLLAMLAADDVASKKYQAAWQALCTCAASTSNAAELLTALDTLQTLLNNIAANPTEDKYKRVRLTNAAFHNKVGRFDGALDVLKTVGFVNESLDGQPVLRLRRNDPGLLWLVSSAVKSAIEQVHQKLASHTA